MATYCVVKNGVVVNIVEWDGVTPFAPAEDHDEVVAAQADAGIEWKFDRVKRKFDPYTELKQQKALKELK